MSQSCTKLLLKAASLSCLAETKTINFGVMTDIHMSLHYKEDIASRPSYCVEATNAVQSKDIANFGRIGCDPPPLLIETMMKIMATQHADLDVILLLGDFTGHGAVMEPTKNYDKKT